MRAGAGALSGSVRHRSLKCPLAMRLALGEPRRLRLERQRRGTPVTVDAVRHQRVAGVEHLLDGHGPVPLLAGHHVAAGEDQVVEDGIGGGPLLEQMVALEERIVAVARVRDDQRLRRHRVLLHQVRDARIGVDDDLVGEPLHAPAIGLLVAYELLAVRPVRVADRQPARRVGVEHLLGGDDLDLVGIGVEPVLRGHLRDRRVVALQQLEVPVGAVRNRDHACSLGMTPLIAVPC